MKRRGFTLLELLVTIGIIILLITILLPVASKVRKAAWAADTQNTINVLVGTIERYHTDFHSYPGFFPNSDCVSSLTPHTVPQYTPPAPGTPFPLQDYDKATNTVIPYPASEGLTETQNLTISLIGGVTFTRPTAMPNYPTAMTFDYRALGQGQQNGNPLITASVTGQYPAYIDYQQRLMRDWAQNLFGTVRLHDVPEFTDGFPDPMPILYLRAKVGAPGVVDPETGVSAATENTNQYNWDHLSPYINPSGAAATAVWGNTGQPFGSAAAYFSNPSIAGQPVQKDGYVLISAGKDRKFGTKDDICNFGTPGQ